MALVELIFNPPKLAKVGVVTFDASVNESHRKTNSVTDHPVEEGANIVDHIRRMPDEITIQGVVTATPIYIAPALTAPNPVPSTSGQLVGSDRVDAAYERLERMMNDGELVDVFTTLKQYENMALESLEVTRNARTGNAMFANMKLRQVRTAVAEKLSLPTPVTDANQPVKDGGKKPTKPAGEGAATKAEQTSSTRDALGQEKFSEVGLVF